MPSPSESTTAAGAIAIGALERKGIRIRSHIRACAGIEDRPFAQDEQGLKADFAALTDEDITFTFDTVFIVRKASENVDLTELREYLNSIGDSLVIGEDDEAFKVHVHTDIPGAALNEAQKYGTLELAKIENMRTQYEDMAAGRAPQSTADLDMEEIFERLEDVGLGDFVDAFQGEFA